MSSAVHEPSEIQGEHVASHAGHKERVPVGLSVQVPRKVRRQVETEECHQRNVESLLETDHGILEKVRAVDGLSLEEHLWMLLAHQPADVGEKESTIHVMRIGIGFRVLVMNAVVPCPFVKIILKEKNLVSRREPKKNRNQVPLKRKTKSLICNDTVNGIRSSLTLLRTRVVLQLGAQGKLAAHNPMGVFRRKSSEEEHRAAAAAERRRSRFLGLWIRPVTADPMGGRSQV